MRFTLKKVVTWFLTAGCIFLVTFNFYNRHVWIITDRSRPWGQDFDTEDEHNRVHRPLMPKLSWSLNKSDLYRNETNITERVIKTKYLPEVKVTIKDPPFLVWPDKEFYDNDRILNQLKYTPPPNTQAKSDGGDIPYKQILLYSGLGGWSIKRGRQQFIDQECRVRTCEITDNKAAAATADAVLFHHPTKSWTTRPPHQIWVLFMLESPYHTPGLSAFAHTINWTATYRHDSDIVAPYEKFVPYNDKILTLPQNRSYATGKTKQVAWFVSNCGGRNGRREYAAELAKYISVDIYGACGTLKCPRHSAERCFEMLNKDYKFYLAFENSNCRDYITEKFFVNGLQHDVIPVVMGAAPEDYKRAAPPHSYIHVDDFDSPKELAEYLIKLDQNDDLYNEYFQWKGTGRNINTFFWCRICSMLHAPRESHSYRDLERWWRGPEVCIGNEKWRNKPRKSKIIVDDFL